MCISSFLSLIFQKLVVGGEFTTLLFHEPSDLVEHRFQIRCHVHKVNLPLIQGFEQATLSVRVHDLRNGGLAKEPAEPVHAVPSTLADEDHDVHIVRLVSWGLGYTKLVIYN